jgi:thiol-disulfide isomerase/thioredoxin
MESAPVLQACPMKPWIAILVLVALCAMPAHAAGIEGQAAPAFSLADAAGTRRSLDDVALGRPAVVVYWATWCPYCKALLPHLKRLSQQYQGRLAIVAINVWDEPEVDPYAWMRERDYEFIVLGRGDRSAKAWGVKGTPGLFVVDGTGVVSFDRSARPFAPTPGDAAQSGVPDRRTSTERSASLWAAAVADVVGGLLPP